VERRLELAALHRGYVPPAGLTVSRPREVRLSTGGRFLFALAMVFFAGAIAVSVGLWLDASSKTVARRQLETNGVDTTGTVIGLSRRKDDKKTPMVVYRFDVNGREYRRERSIPLSHWSALTIGSPFAIRYAAADPDINVPQGRQIDVPPRPLPFVVGPAIAAIGVVFLLGIHSQRQMLTDGRVAPARVTGHTSHTTSHGGKHRNMTYEFTVLSGAVHTGKAGTSSKPPAIGSVICVIYDPERPEKNRPYPLELVRPA